MKKQASTTKSQLPDDWELAFFLCGIFLHFPWRSLRRTCFSAKKEAIQSNRLARYGFFGIPFPKKYGGAGGDNMAYAMAIEELSKVCATSATIVAAHTSLCCYPIYGFGSEEQKMKYPPDLLSGRKIGAFGLTEPNAGSDSAGQRGPGLQNCHGYSGRRPCGCGFPGPGHRRGAINEAVKYTKERVQIGKRISQFQNTQFQLADMQARADAAQMLAYRAAMAKDAGDPKLSYYSAMAKLVASEMASDVTRQAVQLFGGYGYTREYPVERWWGVCWPWAAAWQRRKWGF